MPPEQETAETGHRVTMPLALQLQELVELAVAHVVHIHC